MEELKQFKLISGDFSAEDATAILLSFYNTKILFHNRQLLRMAEQGLDGAETIESKIDELNLTKSSIIAFLQDATRNNQLLAVEGVLNLKMAKAAIEV